MLEHRNKEIAWLKEKIDSMAEMIAILKQQKIESITPQLTFSGKFNLCIAPELHARLAMLKQPKIGT